MLKSSIITISTLIIILVFVKTTSGTFNPSEAILTSIATIIGTILALTFTLSIIPIQTFGTTWSTIIGRIYKQDKKILFAYISIALLTILTILLAIKEIYAPLSGIVCLAITFDILRWYYGYVCQLLDPQIAIKALTDKAKYIIDKYSNAAARYAINCIKTLSYENKDSIRIEVFETQFYQQQTYYLDSIYYFTNELSEITSKGITVNNTSIANTALKSLTQIICYYLDKRKNNLQLGASPTTLFLVTESDADQILNHSFNLIKQTYQLSLNTSNESVCLMGLQQYCNIALHLANLNNRTISLVYFPLSYIKESVRQSLAKSSIEIPFQTTEKVFNLACKLPINSPIESTYTPIIEWLGEVCLYFAIIKKPELISEVSNRITCILYFLLYQDHQQFEEILKQGLDQINIILSFSLTSLENNNIGVQLNSPLSGAYSLTRDFSIARLFELASSKIKDGKPSYVFFQTSEKIYGHFRTGAKECDFGNSLMLQEIIETIKHIIKIFINLFFKKKESEHDDYDGEKKLINEIKRYLSVLTLAFSNKKIIDFHKMKEACDVVAYTGIIISSSPWFADNILEYCNHSLFSMIESYSKTKQEPIAYEVVTLMMFLWKLRLIAEKNNLSSAIKIIDQNLSKKPTQLDQNVWTSCITHFETKKTNFSNYIKREEQDRLSFGESSDDILIKSLNEQNNKSTT